MSLFGITGKPASRKRTNVRSLDAVLAVSKAVYNAGFSLYSLAFLARICYTKGIMASTPNTTAYPGRIFFFPVLSLSETIIEDSAVECAYAIKLRKLFNTKVLVDFEGNAHIYEENECVAEYNQAGLLINGST